jgi:hypothetical protein
MKNNSYVLGLVVTALLFSTSATLLVIWPSGYSTYAQQDNTNQTLIIDQLVSNLSQAKETVASGNSTAVTIQLTGIIGELSDILGKITTDENGQHLDEHTHFFNHKGHTHTVTHKHPHNTDHHHQGDWFERHHIFNPNDCKPGRMC